MNEVLTREKILEAAEVVLRRFGSAKTNVVDVARALGVSHGSVYRHFASKAELRDAVVETWLKRTSEPLAKFVAAKGPALPRLRGWFDALRASKRAKVSADPEMFAMSRALFAEARDVISAHEATLTGQIAAILRDGIASGEFAVADADATAVAIFDATARFHDPAHSADWADPATDKAFEGVWALITAALLPHRKK